MDEHTRLRQRISSIFALRSFSSSAGSCWPSLNSGNLVFIVRLNSAVAGGTQLDLVVVLGVALKFLRKRYISYFQFLSSRFAVWIIFFTVLTNHSTSPFAPGHGGVIFRRWKKLPLIVTVSTTGYLE